MEDIRNEYRDFYKDIIYILEVKNHLKQKKTF